MIHDAVIVGGGPNGLAAAIELQRGGYSVLVCEAKPEIGGAAKSMELTLPGYVHDPFSAVHPLAAGSPFLRTLPLEEYGLRWVHPPTPLAHPLDDGSAIVLERSVTATAAQLEGSARDAYESLMRPLSSHWAQLSADILAPPHFPDAPVSFVRFGLNAIRSAGGVANRRLTGGAAAALFAGLAGHAGIPFDVPGSAAYGLVLGAAGHAVGWPVPAGGAGNLTRALAAYFQALGGEIRTGEEIGSLDQVPASRAILLDLTPRQVLKLSADLLPPRHRRRLQRYGYGPGVFKVDWALSGPIPWRSGECRRAATVHLGGNFDEIASSMRCVAEGGHPQRPFVLLVQPTLFDPSRAPEGCHTAWAYCHVPIGSPVDMLERIEAQVERFAPGFRDLVLARNVLPPAALERLDANLVGGDVNGGSPGLGRLILRPLVQRDPYATPMPGVYICSAATPPGGGVHGMCGYHAARSALKQLR